MPKVTRQQPIVPRPSERHKSLSLLSLAVVAFALSLGGLIRATAMPVEARTQEVWYGYTQELKYDFTARVEPGAIYSAQHLSSQELLRVRLPVEPPAFRRVLVTQLTESITLALPYSFAADRPGDIKVTYRVDGTLTVPGLWQRPLSLLPAQEMIVSGTEVRLDDLAVYIPVGDIVQELRTLTTEMKVSHEQAELRVRPVFQVEVAGQREPVTTGFAPDIVVNIRGSNHSIEVDEPQVHREEKSLSVTSVVPITVNILGLEVRVAIIRQVALTALALFATGLGLTLFFRWLRRQGMVANDLKRLGTSLITAKGFELPTDATIIDVKSASQLITLHLQTDRPVIRVGPTCYLLDGVTCYRLSLADLPPEAYPD